MDVEKNITLISQSIGDSVSVALKFSMGQETARSVKDVGGNLICRCYC